MNIKQIRRLEDRAYIILNFIPGLSTPEAIKLIVNQFRGILEEHEPGELITKGHCPNCGISLSIEYGDEEGEIGIITC
jgi:hypothetical protein